MSTMLNELDELEVPQVDAKIVRADVRLAVRVDERVDVIGVRCQTCDASPSAEHDVGARDGRMRRSPPNDPFADDPGLFPACLGRGTDGASRALGVRVEVEVADALSLLEDFPELDGLFVLMMNPLECPWWHQRRVLIFSSISRDLR